MAKKRKEQPISIAAFARRRGVSRDTVVQYMDEGKLMKAIFKDPKTGYRKIYPEAGDRELARNMDSTNAHSAANGGGAVRSRVSTQPAEEGENEERGGGLSYIELKKKRAMVQLQQDAIRLRRMKGELVDKDTVYKALFQFGKMLRDSVLAVPDQITDTVMAAQTRTEVHRIITESLEDSLRQLSEAGNLQFDDGKKVN
jgi:hypothetical protein